MSRRFVPRHFSGRRGRSFTVLANVLLLVIALMPVRVEASECFRDPAPAIDGVTNASTAIPATLATTFVPAPDCEYATDETREHPIRLDARRIDVATLIARLQQAHPTASLALPVHVYACRGAACRASDLRQRHSDVLFTDPCVSELIAGEALVRFRARADTQSVWVASTSDHACDAAATALVLVPGATSAGTCSLRDCGSHRLELGAAREIELPAGHDEWTVYGARSAGDTALRLGTVRPSPQRTPLQAAFAAPDARWFRARWARGGLELERTSEISTIAWDELITATATQQLWLVAQGPDEARMSGETRRSTLVGPVLATARADAVRLPDRAARAWLRQRYGTAASSLVPMAPEWQSLLRSLSVCLIPRYRSSVLSPDGAPPAEASCKQLGRVTQVEPGQPDLSGDVCVSRTVRNVRADAVGVFQGDTGSTQCIPVAGSRAGAGVAAAMFATVGDTLDVRAPGATVFACVDAEREPCQPIGRGFAFRRAGLYEIRPADSADHARNAQAVAWARVVVLSPHDDWLPVGLGLEGGPSSGHAWSTLPHEDNDTFVFIRRRSALTFHVRTTPAGAASVNAPAFRDGDVGIPSRPFEVRRLAREIPTLASTVARQGGGAPGEPPASALVVIPSLEGSCPREAASVLASRATMDPNGLLVDRVFYVFLAEYQGDNLPLVCLARAAFRIRAARTLGAGAVLTAGLLGDTQLMVAIGAPPALIVSQPIMHGFLRVPLPREFPLPTGFDLSLSATAGFAFDDGGVNRLGLTATLAIVSGLWFAPRLVSLGIGANLLVASSYTHLPVFGFIGLNLSSLIDFAGGR